MGNLNELSTTRFADSDLCLITKLYSINLKIFIVIQADVFLIVFILPLNFSGVGSAMVVHTDVMMCQKFVIQHTKTYKYTHT